MKSKFLLAGLVLLGGFVSATLFRPDTTTSMLKVAFPTLRKIDSFEPTKIHLAYEYLFLENVYSTLVEMDPKGGQILPGIAEKAEWIEDELHLKIRDGVKTASGHPITAGDVLASLKRVIILSENTHGNFKDLICPGVHLKSIDDNCPGIERRGETIVLRPGGKKSVLLPMLTAIDFAIIPAASIDPKTLAITDFRETSGIYYVERVNEDGSILLKINPTHFHFSTEIAQEVVFVPFDPKAPRGALDLLDQGLVDHVMTSNATRIEDLIAYADGSSEISLHATMKIRNFVLVFTDRGRAELSPEQRRYLGEEIRRAFQKIYSGVAGYEGSDEFFPALGDGGLTEKQRHDFNAIRSEVKFVTVPKVRVGLFKSGEIEHWAGPIRERLPSTDLYLEKHIPDLHDYGDPKLVPHAFIAGTDTGFMEDINLISYSLNTGFLGLPKDRRAGWMQNYMGMETREERIAALRALHFQALAEPSIVPLMTSSFIALTRRPWRMELSELYANNQLWLIKTR